MLPLSLRSLRGSAWNDILPDRCRRELGAGASMLELLDILDWSVAEADLPFVVGIADDRNGVRFSGSVDHGGLRAQGCQEHAFRIFSISKSICRTA